MEDNDQDKGSQGIHEWSTEEVATFLRSLTLEVLNVSVCRRCSPGEWSGYVPCCVLPTGDPQTGLGLTGFTVRTTVSKWEQDVIVLGRSNSTSPNTM
jgi:hypothetical protein